MRDEPGIDSIREDFVALYFSDLAQGAAKTVEEYYQRYPGFEEVIASEWSRLNEAIAAGRGALAADENALVPNDLASPSGALDSAPRTWRLAQYRIERELGRGGQGTVYLARDESLDRRVALKVLKPAWTGSDVMARRFELEAQALARMDPRGLAIVHDVGVVHGLRFLAMRYVEGQTLARELAERGGATGTAEILRYVALAEKVARVLHRAHEAGILHRDVKPGNVMITPEGDPVLLDFGVARFCEAEGPALTLTGDVIGTPAFMAPEQLAGKQGLVDRRTDVYGLAATLHEALTSRRMTAAVKAKGEAEVEGLLHDARSKSAPTDLPSAFRARAPARRLNPGVSADLDAVLRAALDPDPDHRYDTAAAFADDLGRVLRGLPVAVKPRGWLSTLLLACRRAPAAAALVFLIPAALATGLAALSLKNREIEHAAFDLEATQRDADRAAVLSRLRFAEFQRLDDLRKIQDLQDRERDLWPPAPATEAAMERWLADARELLARFPAHRAALDAVRNRGQIAPSRDAEIDPAVAQKLHYEEFRDAAKAEARISETPESRRTALLEYAQEADARIAILDRDLESRPLYRFDSVEDQWVHDNLELLVARLEELSGPSLHDCTIASVARRLDLARSVEAISLRQGAAAWDEAVRSIANPATDPAYEGLEIEPILGLIPIGRDPHSRLWEFAVVQSGIPPVRDAGGRLVITEGSAIVLVLVPGGSFRMGARHPRPDEDDGVDCVDSMARANEQPVHELTLEPFLLSKFEMTQGQWLRATGQNPSHHRPDRQWEHGYRPDLRHPVEKVNFEDCEGVLRRFGLVLPTEAQWEYAARAGTTTPWWSGSTIESFLHDENLADRTLMEVEEATGPHDAARNDGWTGPAPVGTFPANPWGFHDVIGNVLEWCADGCDLYGGAVLPGDGLHLAEFQGLRTVRGGAFNIRAISARSSYRHGAYRTNRQGAIGVRPARALREP